MSPSADRRISLRRVFWFGAAVVVAIGALVALVAVVRGHFSETDGRILLSLFALLLCGSLALAGLALVDRGQTQQVGWTSVAVAPVGGFLMLAEIWSWEDESTSRWGKPSSTALLCVLALLLVTTLRLLLADERLVRSVWLVALVCAPTAAGIGAVLIWTNGGHGNLGRFAAALAIVAGACYLIGPIAQRAFANSPARNVSKGQTPHRV